MRHNTFTYFIRIHKPDSWLVRPCNHQSSLLTLYPTLTGSPGLHQDWKHQQENLLQDVRFLKLGGKNLKKKQQKKPPKFYFEVESLQSAKESNAQKLHPSLSDRKNCHIKKETSQV